MRHRDFIKEKRQIRVFISSSFEDMKDERNYLRDVVLPLIQEKARKRAVAVTVLDLRWGIPAGTELGKTIEICMNEIDNSFPFFIGIIGGHYGTQPDKIKVFDSNVILREQYSVLSKYFEKKLSITEMEMRYGVLDCGEDEKKQINALFLTRDSDLDTIGKDCRLKVLNGDIQACGERFNEARIICDKKNHIWTSNYCTIEEFGRIVRIVFEDILDRLFPEDTNQDGYREQFLMQQSILTDLSRFYVPNMNQLIAINNFIDSPSKQLLLITGKSGSGKSSLLAYWISTQAKEYSEKGVDSIYHFVGSGGTENNFKQIEKRILHEIITGLDVEPPINNEEKSSIYTLFSRSHLRKRRKLLLIIDAVNQLNTGLDLSWLHLHSLPQDVKLIISTLHGDDTENIIRKFNPDQFITVDGLTSKSDRKQVVELYVKKFHGRDLGDNNLIRIVNWPLSQNPLALKTLLNELIVTGRYDAMDSLVNSYLSCSSINSLFAHILDRLRTNIQYSWIEKALGAIALSRYGLSEEEILRIISAPLLYWSSFYCSFQRHFFIRNGLITFAHQYLRNAVERTYLTSENTKKSIHASLIDLFEEKENKSARGQEELMHHYFAIGNYLEVFSLVSDPIVFTHLWKNDERNVTSYWEKLLMEGYSPEKLILSYEQFDKLWEENENGSRSISDCDYHDYCANLQRLLLALHLHGPSVKLFSVLEKYIEEESTHGLEHIRRHAIIAESYEVAGYLEKAIDNYKKSFWRMTSSRFDSTTGHSINVFKQGFDENETYADPVFAETCISISACYRRLGLFDKAKKFLDEAKRRIDPTDETERGQAKYVSFLLESFRFSCDNGNYAEADGYLRNATGKVASYLNIAEKLFLFGDYPKAISTWHSYIKLLKGDAAKSIGVETSIVYRRIADALMHLQKYTLAEVFINASLNYIRNRVDSDYLQAENYVLFGHIYYFKKDYVSSFDFFMKSVVILERLKLWPELIGVCQETAIVSTWNNNTLLGISLLKRVLSGIERGRYCSDFQRGQLLWTISRLEFLLGSFVDCFEHACSAFNLIINKLGKNNEQSLEIIQLLDNCLDKEPSINTQLSPSSISSPLTEWDRYVLLRGDNINDPQLRLNLICNGLITDYELWKITQSLLKSLDPHTIEWIIEAYSTEELLDRLLSHMEQDYDRKLLMRVLMMIILSPNGVKMHRIVKLTKDIGRETLTSLFQKYGALFTMQHGRISLSIDRLKGVVVSHYFRYDENDYDILVSFADEMARVCPEIMFPYLSGSSYYKQLKQDAKTLKNYLLQTCMTPKTDIDITQKTIKLVSKYCSPDDDIMMSFLIRYFNKLLSYNEIGDNNLQRVADNLYSCVNFRNVPNSTRGNVFLVRGMKAYNEKNYISSLPYLAQYWLLSDSNNESNTRIRCYRSISECLPRLSPFEINDALPMGFMEMWKWDSNKYKYLDESITQQFSITDIIENKGNNQIIVLLDEKPSILFTYKSSHKFSFVKYAIETQVSMKGEVNVLLRFRRGLWHDLDDDSEQMNLYPTRHSDGVKYKEFNDFIHTVYNRFQIRRVSDSKIE